MRLIRQLIRDRLTAFIPTLARVDRFNHQYEKMDEEDPVDWSAGAVYIELIPGTWETLGGGLIQETEATVRLHICREFYGSSASDEDITDPWESLSLPEQVFVALQGAHLTDADGRTVATTLTRTSSTEDNDHDALEVDIMEFTTRITDYSAERVRFKKMATLKLTPTINTPGS